MVLATTRLTTRRLSRTSAESARDIAPRAHYASGMTKNARSIAAALLALAAMAGTPRAIAAPPESGTISIETTADGVPGAVQAVFAGAVSEAFGTRGFTMIEEAGHAALVAELRLSREQVGTAPAAVPVEDSVVTPGDSSNRVGAGISIALPTAKRRLVPLERTRLELRLHRRDETAILWQGTAMTVRAAGTRTGRDDAVAADLTEALLRTYPAQPDGIVTVP
jgi:hypothetical protein